MCTYGDRAKALLHWSIALSLVFHLLFVVRDTVDHRIMEGKDKEKKIEVSVIYYTTTTSVVMAAASYGNQRPRVQQIILLLGYQNVATDHNHYSTYGYHYCSPSQSLLCMRVNERASRPGVGVVCVRVWVCVFVCTCVSARTRARGRVCVVLRANIMRARRVAAAVRVDISGRLHGRCAAFRTGHERRPLRTMDDDNLSETGLFESL